jgi:predicted PurR-regulated permease PerM
MKYSELENSSKVILKVIFAALAVVLLWTTRDIILILILALILSSVMDPMVNYFKQHKIPRAVSVLTVYLLFIGLVIAFGYLLIPIILEQFKILTANLPAYASALDARFGNFFAGFSISEYLGHALSGVTSGNNVVNSTFGIVNGFVTAISVLVISFYLTAEEKGLKTFINTLIPEQHRDFTLNIVSKIQEKMGLWILGQIIVSVLMFAFTFIGLSALGVPYALILALVAGLLEVIPYIGPFVAAIPALLIALLQSPALAVAVAGLYFLLHEIEANILVPKVMEKTVGTSPLAVLIALLVGFKLAGVVGIILAVPVVGAITVIVNELSSRKPSQ